MTKVRIAGALALSGALALVAAAGATTTSKKVSAVHKRHRANAVAPAPGRPTMTPAQTYAYWTAARMRSATPPTMSVVGGAQPTSPSQPSGGSGSSAPGARLGAPSEGH